MARQKRLMSETGIYHIMLSGINKQQVFHDTDDYQKFISILGICKGISGFKIHAYCIMNNHVHLLIQTEVEPLDIALKRMGNRFVYWYNIKYKRSGNIFQGRYKSIPVNDDQYFVSVLRYIHQNPVKAGIVKKCEDYQFSSYNAYLHTAPLVDTEFTLSLMSIDEFKRYHGEANTDYHLDIPETETIHLNDDEAMRIVEECTKCKNIYDFQKMPRDMQFAYAHLLKGKGLSIRQISRLTGLSRGFVERS